MHMKRTPALAQVPVVLLTGAFEPIDEARARQTGCDGVLVKPFEPRQLLTQVRALLAGTRPADLWPADMPRIVAAPPPAAPPPAPPPSAAPVQGPRLVPPPPREVEQVSPRSAPSFEDVQEPGPIRSAPPVEAEFELGLDDLDLAFSRLDPVAAPSRLDADTVSDFQRDIRELRSAAPDEAPRERVPAAPDVMGRMDWDLPTQPVARELDAEPMEFVDAFEPPPPVPVPPPPVERHPFPLAPSVLPSDPEPQPFPVASPVPVQPAAVLQAAAPPLLAVPEPAPLALPTASLASAFSALLAAEQVHPQLRPAAAGTTTLPESAVEEVVKRVLTRMTDEVVRKVVLETAERLIREEIDRIKPDR